MSEPIGVVVVTYNSRTTIAPCLTALCRQDYPSFRLYVIDNASSDETTDCVRRAFPSVTITQNRTNVGFAQAVNQGIDLALAHGAGFVALLNPDMVTDPSWLSELLAAFQAGTRVGIVQSKIYLSMPPSQILNSAGNEQHYLGFGYCSLNGSADDLESDTRVRPLAFASGGSCLLSKELLAAIGGLDESYFMYHEDVDFGLRARLAGFSVLYAPRSVVWHEYRFEKGQRKYYYLERNRLRTLLKNYALKTLLLLTPAIVITEFAVLAQAARGGWLWLKLRSYLEVLSALPELWRARLQVQQLRIVLDRDLAILFVPRVVQAELHGRGLAVMNSLWAGYWSLVKSWI